MKKKGESTLSLYLPNPEEFTLCSCFLEVFTYDPIFKQIYLTIDGTLTGTTTLYQSGLGSNGYEGVIISSLISNIGTLFLTLFFKGYS